MTTSSPLQLAAMMAAADIEWRTNAYEDWTTINFWRWPWGFHRSAWVIAGYIGWNPLDALDKPTPAVRAVNALLTRLRVTFTVVMTRHTPDPRDPDEPLLIPSLTDQNLSLSPLARRCMSSWVRIGCGQRVLVLVGSTQRRANISTRLQR